MLNKRTLPLSGLRAFECAGRHLHLGRAGEELGVTHGAISHQVRALEAQLGVKLFIRANSRLQLTDAGQRLLTAVGEGFEKILEGAQHLDPDSLAGNLIIACTQTAGASWMAKHICDFQAQYPQIDIHTVEVKPQQRDIPREIDVAICYGKPQAGDRKVEELTTPDIFPVCSPRLVHGKGVVLRPDQLTRFPLIHDTQNSWRRWFDAMQIAESDDVNAIYFFNTTLSLAAARQAYGIALCNHFEVQEDLREGRLIKLFDQTIPESQSYYLLTDRSENQSLRAQIFETWIKEILTSPPTAPK